jgi:hypothetical protein
MDTTHACHKLIENLTASEVDVVSNAWIKDSAMRHVLRSLSRGDYHQLPTPVYDELMSYARSFVADDVHQFVIALDTQGAARVLFLVNLGVTLRGVELERPAIFAVPDDIDDIDIPVEFADLPIVAFDITLPE